MKNIVFFGPTNAGKSTMIGYLYCQSLSPQQFNQELDEIKSILGQDYQQDRLYSYFVDKAKDERKKIGQDNKQGSKGNPQKGPKGTSKKCHLRPTRINNEDVLLIDTPGASEYIQEKVQGISMATIGVFAIEIKQLIGDSDSPDAYKVFDTFFNTWFLWKKMSGLKNTIILLTKYDQCAGEKDFEEAKSCLSMLLGADDIKETIVIPTSVTVEKNEGREEGKDINVTTKLKEEWYRGKSFMDALIEKGKSVNKENRDMPLLMFHIKDHKRFEQSNLSQWKILQGMISSKDKIKIAPVELTDKSVKTENKYTSIEATIDSISPYTPDSKKGKFVKYADSGSVNDIMLVFEEGKYSILPTAIAIKPNEELSIGNCIDLEIRKEDCTEKEWLEMLKIYPKKQLSMLWFSRIISVRAKKIDLVQSGLYRLKILIDGNDKIALPKRRLQLQMVMIRLQVNHNIDNNKDNKEITTAINAKVVDIS